MTKKNSIKVALSSVFCLCQAFAFARACWSERKPQTHGSFMHRIAERCYVDVCDPMPHRISMNHFSCLHRSVEKRSLRIRVTIYRFVKSECRIQTNTISCDTRNLIIDSTTTINVFCARYLCLHMWIVTLRKLSFWQTENWKEKKKNTKTHELRVVPRWCDAPSWTIEIVNEMYRKKY